MPSASAKLEKQASLEASEPLKQVLNVVEKKVRNLEKRKGKLDVYKEESAQGKELNDDQKNAVSRYEEVVQSLEVARELQKQFVQITQDAVKSGKKQAKRDQLERQLHELQRVKEVLKVQDVLSGMGDETTRADFLSGVSGAPVLTEENLTLLDKLYKLITPAHEVDEAGQTYEQQLTSASEHLVAILDGRNKEVMGTTYKGLKELIFRIHDCGYFNQVENHEVEVANGDEVENQCADDGFVENVDEGVPETLEENEQLETKVPEESVPALNVETPVQPDSCIVAPSISPDDNSVFSTFTHNRPYTEVISGSQGSFNFLQESQIDLESPHMDPAVVAAHPMVPTSRAYQTGETFTSAYQSQHVGTDQTIVRGVSPTANVPPTPQATQYVQQIPSIQPAEFSQIPTQTFTNQNYVTLQTFSPAVYGQVPAQTVPQAAVVNGPPPSIGMIGNEQQSAGIPEPKKHYMNVNATAFESVAYKQTSADEPEPVHKPLSNQPGVDDSEGQDDASTFPSQTDPDASGNYPRESSSPNNFQSKTGFSTAGRNGGGGNRGTPRGPRGMTNGYSGRGSRPNASFNNGRGSSNYQGYRNEGNNFYQNGYQRENFGGQSNYNGFKQRGASNGTRGSPRPGGSRGNGNNGMSRGNPRGAYIKPAV